MKAAVITQHSEKPQYTDFPDPISKNDQEVVINVTAAAIKHLDKSIASGQHYSASSNKTSQPRLIGGDGVGTLPDGSRVYGLGNGFVAEKVAIDKSRMVYLPQNLDDATAAAIANGVIGSAMALRFRANIIAGDTVLINGATSFTGKLAIQIAKLYGAGKIIATGRNPEVLQKLHLLGADQVISLAQADEAVLSQIKAIHTESPINIIIDYLWGHSAELLFSVLQGRGTFTPVTRYVSVGGITGDTAEVPSSLLRSVNLQLTGSGLGSWTKQNVATLFSEILPEMFQLAADGKLTVETTTLPLKDIAQAYDLPVHDGKRLVILI